MRLLRSERESMGRGGAQMASKWRKTRKTFRHGNLAEALVEAAVARLEADGAEARERSPSPGRQRNAGQDQDAADGDPPSLTHICKCAGRPQPLQHAGKHQGCGKNDWGENDDVWMVLQSF